MRQNWSRGQIELAATLPCLIGVESLCRHDSRKLQVHGYDAQLMPAKYMRQRFSRREGDCLVGPAPDEEIRHAKGSCFLRTGSPGILAKGSDGRARWAPRRVGRRQVAADRLPAAPTERNSPAGEAGAEFRSGLIKVRRVMVVSAVAQVL
jgi:hypothetical protein